MKNKLRNISIYVLFFASIILIKGVELPDRTHHYAIVLLNNLHNINNDILTQLYTILITVWHKYIEITLFNIYLYQIAVYSIYFFILFIIVNLREKKTSPIQLILLLLLFILTANTEFTYNLVGNKLFPPDMFNGQISNRTIFWFSAALSIYYLIIKKIKNFLIFYLLASILHPTSGVMLFILNLTYLLLAKYNQVYENKEEYLKYFLIIISALVIPGYKYISIKKSADNYQSFGIINQDYINSQYSNEGDDFSILYPFISSFTNDGWSFPFIIFAAYLVYKVINKFKFFLENENNKIISDLLLSSIIFWIAVIFAIELIYVTSRENGYLNNITSFPLVFFINIQAGSKILSFITIYFFSLLIIIFSKENYTFKTKRLNILFYLLIVFIIIYSSFNKIKEFNFIGANKSIVTPLEALKTTEKLGFVGTYSFCKQLYYQDFPETTNEKINIQIVNSIIDRSKRISNHTLRNYLFNDPQELINFAEWIIQFNNTKVIIPPYIPCLREIILPVIPFFQEHDDGNLALGSTKIYFEVMNRMNQLEISYFKIPFRQSGYDLSGLAKSYDQIPFETFQKISKSGWCKLIVKKEQAVKFPISPISTYNDWLLFDLCEN